MTSTKAITRSTAAYLRSERLAKSPARPLKVFEAQFGFYETVVAVPSQAAALRLWGTRQNLFASGDARLTTDHKAIKAACEHPGQMLSRPLGSKKPYSIAPIGLPVIRAAPEKTHSETPAHGKPPTRNLADRSDLDRAETALRNLLERRRQEEAALQQDVDDLDRRRAAAQSAFSEARLKADEAVTIARRLYRKGGGQT